MSDQLTFGLIGQRIGYSFSPAFFGHFFAKNGWKHQYQLFDCQSIEKVKTVLHDDAVFGFNVTIPYKKQIIPLLSELTPAAESIGAVNVVYRNKNGLLVGDNTDFIGFRQSLLETLVHWPQMAFVLGTGGASLAVAYVLEQLRIPFFWVSRTASAHPQVLHYDDLLDIDFPDAVLWVQTTPLGSEHATDQCPAIPYEKITNQHSCFDLVYQPEKTLFLMKAQQKGATIQNGSNMLHYQALAAWNLWAASM
ncbi:MAG: shikimate dehydrogenase [Flavobacterium sp. BFFFF2]|nr:MAG: shikimate dehydrogenase [Flavobacterium sp. BFFFF2]